MTSPAGPALRPIRDRTAWAQAGVILAFVAMSSAAQWYFAGHSETPLATLLLGVLVFEPIMLGIWTALGPGTFVTRLPIALPCLMLLFVAPGYLPEVYKQLQLGEFVATVLMGYAVFAIAIVLFALFRRFTHFRLELKNQAATENTTQFKFSIKYLFALITIYALVFGMTSQLHFQSEPPSPGIFHPMFFIEVVVIGGAVVSAAVLPTTAVPLSILHGSVSQRAVAQALTFWAVVTGTIIVFTIDAEDPSTIGFALLTQLGATLAGAVAAFILRSAGLRLVRDCHTPKIKSSAKHPISV